MVLGQSTGGGPSEGVLDLIPDLICHVTPEGVLLWMNVAYAQIHGKTREELIGTSLLDLLDGEVREAVAGNLKESASELTPGSPVRVTVGPGTDADGNSLWLEFNDHGLFENGRLSSILSIGRDRTQYHRQSQRSNELSDEVMKESDRLGTLLGVGRADGFATQIEQALALVTELEDRTRQITQVASLIKGIANQTNLLALNASIEAARAGEHGRGFAVVASEVKTLSRSTSDSLAAIDELTGELTTGINKVARVMDLVADSSEKIRTSVGSLAGIATELGSD